MPTNIIYRVQLIIREMSSPGDEEFAVTVDFHWKDSQRLDMNPNKTSAKLTVGADKSYGETVVLAQKSIDWGEGVTCEYGDAASDAERATKKARAEHIGKIKAEKEHQDEVLSQIEQAEKAHSER